MNRTAVITAALASALSLACQESGYPEDCLGLDAADAAACVEDQFWPAFQTDFDDRLRVFDVLTGVMEEHPEQPRAFQLRPLLGVAISSENGVGDITDPGASNPYIINMRGDLHRAVALDASSDFYLSWRISADLTTALFLDNETVLEAFIDEGLAHANKNPERNLMALISSFMIFPIDTGLPARAKDMLDQWVADGYGYQTADDPRYPYARAGVDYMIGEMYARVGNRDMAYFNYDQARVKGADWPYRFLADEALADLDGRMAAFAAFPDDQTPITEMATFGPYACKMCHASE